MSPNDPSPMAPWGAWIAKEAQAISARYKTSPNQATTVLWAELRKRLPTAERIANESLPSDGEATIPAERDPSPPRDAPASAEIERLARRREAREAAKAAREAIYAGLRVFKRPELATLNGTRSEDHAAILAAHASTAERPDGGRALMERVARYCPPGGTIIDVGCGVLPLAFPWGKRPDVRYWALEPDPVCLARLGEWAASGNAPGLRVIPWRAEQGFVPVETALGLPRSVPTLPGSPAALTPSPTSFGRGGGAEDSETLPGSFGTPLSIHGKGEVKVVVPSPWIERGRGDEGRPGDKGRSGDEGRPGDEGSAPKGEVGPRRCGGPPMADVALLAKLVPLLARHDPRMAAQMAAVPAWVIVVTASTQALARRQTIRRREEKALRPFLDAGQFGIVETFETADEWGYVLERRGREYMP